MKHWDSVAMADENYYNIQYHSTDASRFIDFITMLLEIQITFNIECKTVSKTKFKQ